MSKPAQANTIPLFCSLCPNGPKFSDLSHLLTHIASRAHIANEEKLRVLSRTSQESQSQLDRYVYWYETNEIRQLLDKRRQLKESRPPRVRRAAQGKTTKKEIKPPLSSSLLNKGFVKLEGGADDHQMAFLLQNAMDDDLRSRSNQRNLSSPSAKHISEIDYKKRFRFLDYSRVADFDLPDGEFKDNHWPGARLFGISTASDSKTMSTHDISASTSSLPSPGTESRELVISSEASPGQPGEAYANVIDPQLTEKGKPRRALGERDPNQNVNTKRQKKTHGEPFAKELPASPQASQRSPAHVSPPREFRPPLVPVLPPGYYIVGPDHQPVPYQHYPFLTPYLNSSSLVLDREITDSSRLYPAYHPFFEYARPFDYIQCNCDSCRGLGPTLSSECHYHGPEYSDRLPEHHSVEPSQIEKSPLLLTSPVQSDDADHET